MGEIGFQELIIIGLLVLVFFGPKKLPELGTGLGKAIRDFKRAVKGTDSVGATESPVSSKSEL